ncbi:P-loop containing nucleoside triphosphate hydrolase protein, partial [Thamnocephalis sphaerospora]
AVQTAVVPRLLRHHDRNGVYVDGDLCVSAPTGSGKTLAYVLPIVETLRKRVVTRLRALIVLPTRDLVAQVKETFDEFCRSTDLKVGVAVGQTSFASEQTQLVSGEKHSLLGGSSRVDILIATPGRLIDHLNGTSNFTLQHLRFLVIDEADRLLGQSYQDWLPRVLDALPTTRPSPPSAVSRADDIACALPCVARLAGPPQPRVSMAAPWQTAKKLLIIRVHQTQKLLFSATLTRNPAKIASLRLVNPVYVAVQAAEGTGRETERSLVLLKAWLGTADTAHSPLQEHYIVCRTVDKPLMVLHLLASYQLTSTLCFTKSIESANRLSRLLQIYCKDHDVLDMAADVQVSAEYSSDLTPSERAHVMKQFRRGKIRLLICSDLVARGVDMDCVQAVISYDVPLYMKKYIHRVGRTARANRKGSAFTLVEEQEARAFKEMMRKAAHWEKVKRISVKPAALEPLVPRYEVCGRGAV